MELNGEHIYIAGCSVKELVEEYGTPIYVYDADKIRSNYTNALKIARKYFRDFQFFYAIKACNNLAIADILVSEGAGIDAASVNEIKLAKALGLSGERIMFTGNYLSDDDIIEGYNSGAIVNLDDESLLPRLLKCGVPDVISFRINPGYGRSTLGQYVTNAGPKAKFGVHPNHVVGAYRAAKQAGIKRFGGHMMPGSCLLEASYFHKITDLLLKIIGKVIKEVGINFDFLNLGGGLGIPYRQKELPLDIESTMKGVSERVQNFFSSRSLPLPKLLMEPARYFVGNAGYLIGKVHTIKHSYQRIIGTDVSMNILARPAMYDAYHRIYVDGKENDERKKMGLCGQVCENTDYWCKDRPLPSTIEVGDIIVISDAGAYGYSMSYEYNGRLKPSEVLIEHGKHALIRRRATFSDMVSNMVVPEQIIKRLKKL